MGPTKPLHCRRAIVAALAMWCGTGAGAARETWLKLSTPEITVITTASPKEATTWAMEFTQYIAALRSFFGNSRAELPALTIVVFSRVGDFQRYLPLFAPGGKPQPVGGFFARHESWAVVGVPAWVSDETRRAIFHEGVHWFLSASHTRNPIWLEEGLAEVFSTFHAEKDTAEWGRSIDDHVRLLRAVALPPLEKLLHTAQSELFGDDRARTGIVYAESWAFVHFLMFGKHDIPRNGISRYLEEISSGTNPDEAFRKIFGRTYAEMDLLLRAYLGDGRYYIGKQPLARGVTPSVQPATAVDVENALGRLAIAGKRTAQAMTHAGAAMVAVPADPRGHELFALALQATGDAAGALVEFKAAIERGSNEFQPYFEAASAAHKAAIAERSHLTSAEARTIANGYQRAIRYYPRFLASYENLAGIIGLAEPVGEEDRKVLELGQRLYPESPIILLGLAQLARRGGDGAGALAILDRVLASRHGLSAEGAEFAHRLDIGWKCEDITRRVDELGRVGEFSEAIALLDAKLATDVDSELRLRLTPVREQLEVALLSQQVKAALDRRQWTEARRDLGRLLESSAPPAMKNQARRTLADLDQRKLGLEPDRK